MESISRDAKAFQELADEDNSQKDFSKFSKLELPASVILIKKRLKQELCTKPGTMTKFKSVAG